MGNILGFLDMHTILFTMIITNLVCTLVMLLLWRQNYKRLDGIPYWVANYSFQTLAIILIVLRGSIPDWCSIDLSNTLSIVGIFLGLRGLEKFFHLKTFQGHNYAMLILFPVLFYLLTYTAPDLAKRNLIIGIFSFIFCFQCVWLLFFRVKRSMLRMTVLVGAVFICFCLVDASRVLNYFINENLGNDY
ncbi:MAG: hypothetical protein NTY32_03330, partial [Bacteroidia bacterium]|nr:hypothetical protein [Bacteroidia bacterium]